MARPSEGWLTKALVGRRLRDALEDKGWRPAELARQLARFAGKDVDPSMVRRWVDEKKLPSGAYMVLLARVFGAEWLFPPGETVPGIKRSQVTRTPSRRPAELEKLLGLIRDALLGAVDRALERDHELEQTRRGYRILGDAFLDLGLKLQLNGIDTRELLSVARELQKRGDR